VNMHNADVIWIWKRSGGYNQARRFFGVGYHFCQTYLLTLINKIITHHKTHQNPQAAVQMAQIKMCNIITAPFIA